MKKRKKTHYPSTPDIQKKNSSTHQIILKFIPLVTIILVTIICFWPIFQNSFLAWDDDAYIKNNPLIHSVNFENIFSKYVMGNYHPLTILIYAYEYLFFGLNPVFYHAVNLFIHVLNVVLVYYFILLFCDKKAVALFTALLFGIHPIHVESVAWAAELKDLLYTSFFLLSLIFYLFNLKTSKRKFYFLSLLFFVLSLLSKAMAASLPIVLILLDYIKYKTIDKKAFVEKIPFFLLALIFGVIAIFAQQSFGSTDLSSGFTFLERIILASYAYIFYLFKLLFPLNLSAYYPYPGKISLQHYAYMLLFVSLIAYVFYSLRFSRKILFGLGFFTITILLVLQLFPVGRTIMADRYCYIPSIGLFYLAGEGLFFLWNRKYTWVAVTLASFFTIFYSVKTYARCNVWRDDITLWKNVIEYNPAIAEAYINLGIAYVDNGRYMEALINFNKAVEFNPNLPTAYNHRGLFHMIENNLDKALLDFNKALELKPGYDEVYFNLGNLYFRKERIEDALTNFNKAVELNPAYSEAYNNIGNLRFSQKKFDEAIGMYSKAIALKDNYGQAYYNRGLS